MGRNKIRLIDMHGVTAGYDLTEARAIYLGKDENERMACVIEYDSRYNFIYINPALNYDAERDYRALEEIRDCLLDCWMYEEGGNFDYEGSTHSIVAIAPEEREDEDSID